MNARVTPHQYVLAEAWDLMFIVESANDLADKDAQNANKYVEGGAGALQAYCQRRVREPVVYRAD
jgi:hypothetical protein